MKDFKFAFSTRDDLPDALFSMLGSPVATECSIESIDFTGRGAILGYPVQSSECDYSSPYLIVLPTARASELFAWLKTYAPETFPLSQFGRVVSLDDFKSIKNRSTVTPLYWQRPDRWSAVVLGEMLAQSDGDGSVMSIPLSRATATYSFSVARASIAHRDDSVTQECISRLKRLSLDRRFVERLIDIRSLKEVWKRVGSAWDDNQGAEQLTDKFSSERHDLFGSEPSIQDFFGLLSDSAEHRVVAFRGFAKAWSIQFNGARHDDGRPQMEIALAAFLVGRGTSHAFLLKDIARIHPSVYVWFGLIAALSGPTTWDTSWARAVKGIEKSLKSFFSWSDISPCDISWAEYSWIDSLDNDKVFQDVPKLLPKVLSLEVVPGVVCQFRLKSAAATREMEGSSAPVAAPLHSIETDMLYKFVREFITVADKNKLGITATESSISNDSAPKPKRPGGRGVRKQ